MISLNYKICRGCQLHILSVDSGVQILPSPCEQPSIVLPSSALALLSKAKRQDRIVYIHYLQCLVSGSHPNSLKSGSYPHRHSETSLAKVRVLLFAIFTNSSSY